MNVPEIVSIAEPVAEMSNDAAAAAGPVRLTQATPPMKLAATRDAAAPVATETAEPLTSVTS